MSSFIARFVARMRKHATSAQGKITLDSEGPGKKCQRRSGLEEEA